MFDKTLQKYTIMQWRVENVPNTGKKWRNSAIWGEIRPFLWRKIAFLPFVRPIFPNFVASKQSFITNK